MTELVKQLVGEIEELVLNDEWKNVTEEYPDPNRYRYIVVDRYNMLQRYHQYERYLVLCSDYDDSLRDRVWINPGQGYKVNIDNLRWKLIE